MDDRKKLISIVVPACNEENNVETALSRIADEIAELETRYDFEFVIVDDGSTDTTYEKLKRAAQADRRIRVYRFSRNYGVQRAVHTGFVVARGDAAILLDCDLQDPPYLIPMFLERWEVGYRVVYGVRRTRKEGWLITGARRVFYWLIDKLSPDDLPRDAGDCRLIDRRVIDELKKIRDTNIYVRGRIASMGFQQVGVPYDREARERDESKFTVLGLMGVALDGIVSHSVIPLRLATVMGLLLTLAAFAGAIFYAVGRIFFGADWPPGFATIVVLILLSMGLNGLFLGILGEYLARMYAQLKLVPDPIIETQIVAGRELPGDVTPPAMDTVIGADAAGTTPAPAARDRRSSGAA